MTSGKGRDPVVAGAAPFRKHAPVRGPGEAGTFTCDEVQRGIIRCLEFIAHVTDCPETKSPSCAKAVRLRKRDGLCPTGKLVADGLAMELERPAPEQLRLGS